MYSSLPESVRVVDITPRDGFQNIKAWIPTELKIAVIDRLVASGISRMEATSFVSPKAIPQMADATAIAAHMLEKHPGVAMVALAPNLRGARDAFATGIREVSYVVSASAAHNKANINRTHEESLADLAAITSSLPDLVVNLSMSTVFGCPFTGETAVKDVLRLLGECVKRGIASASLCDTIGVANPRQVQTVIKAVREAFPTLPLSAHLHDTHGMGLANTFAALQVGVTSFETAAGGLGGCPFAPGAAGNTSTEDMVNMLHRMGIATGLSLEGLLEAAGIVRARIKPDIPGRLVSARTYAEFCFFSL